MEETTNRRCPIYQKKLDRIAQNDPYVKEMDLHRFRHSIRDNDDMLELGLALQKSTHVNRFIFDASNLTSIEGSSTVEEYLKFTKSLQYLSILPPRYEAISPKVMKTIADRLLSALQENSSLLELTLDSNWWSYHGSAFSFEALSRYLIATTSLQVLRLSAIQGSICSDLDAHTVARAMQQCHTIKEIYLTQHSSPLMISILQVGLTDHPTLQKLSLNFGRTTPEAWNTAVAEALRQLLNSSTPLRTLHLAESRLCGQVTQQIVKGLRHHPTVESLSLFGCSIYSQEFKDLIKSCCEKLQSLDLNHSMLYFHKNILTALQQSTNLKNLRLACGNDCNEERFPLVETILRKNPQLRHLSLEKQKGRHETAFAFIKTVIQDSGLTTLDCSRYDDFGDFFQERQCWPNLQDPSSGKKCMLRKLSMPETDLTEGQMQRLVTFLRFYTPRLRSLSLRNRFTDKNVTMHFAEWLRTSSLVELCLSDCSFFRDFRDLELIFSVIQKHTSLKKFHLQRSGICRSDLRWVILVAAQCIYDCQLQSLHLDIRVYGDDESAAEENINSNDYLLFMRTFAANTTLTDVALSNDILENMHIGIRKKIYFSVQRNERFSKIISHDDGDENDVFDGTDHWSMVRVDGKRSDSVTTIPWGLWPHILEAAHKQYPCVSMLHQILSSPTGGLLLSSREEKDLSPSATMNSENAPNCRSSKRDYFQISEE
jgi:hypothetical protein